VTDAASAFELRTRRRHGLLAFAVLAAIAVYANALGNGFALDDVAIIQDNPRVHDLSNLRAIWLTPYWPFFGAELGLWRPLAVFGYALQWAAGGGDPLIFHVVNIGLHALVTALVFLLLERLTAAIPAFWGALIFAVHPVHTEVVANVVGQAELITAAALIGACLVHATRDAGISVSPGRAAAIAALFTAALLTKEHAVVLPGLLLSTDLAQRRIPLSLRGAARYGQAIAFPLFLLGAVLSAYLLVRVDVLDGALLGVDAGPQLQYLRGEHRVLNALRAFPEMLRLLVFPASLAADYSPAMILPVEGVTPMVVVGAILLVACLVLASLLPWVPAAGFALAWFLISVVAVSNLLFPIGVLLAERTLYLPSVAVSAGVCYALFVTGPRLTPGARRAISLGLIALVIAGAARTWVRNPDWRSTQTILYALLRDHPESYKAQWTHATWQWQLARPDRARMHYELAYRLYPHDSQLMTDFADFLMQHGNPDRALALLTEAYRIHPFVPRTVVLLGTAFINAGRFDDAVTLADEATRTGVDPVVTMPLRAAAYDGLGRQDQALAAWRYVIQHADLRAREWAHLARNLLGRNAVADAAAAVDRGTAAAAGDTTSMRILAAVRDSIAILCDGWPVAAEATSSPGAAPGGCDRVPDP
jgi:protein O-mannosyl-transferase